MDKKEIIQQLLQLENRDVVQKWFHKIHNRKLNSIRTKEINSAAKQSSEFFENAELASYTVRPLLTFYGISTLSRALILLLKPNSGENSLTAGHGLQTINWSNTLAGSDISERLKNIGQLEVKTCKGLFSELINETQNRISIHVDSGGVDWQLKYDIPNVGFSFTFNELISRIPDLNADLKNIGIEEKYCSVNEMTFYNESGFRCKVNQQFELIKHSFEEFGYTIVSSNNKNYELSCSSKIFEEHLPLFLHKYVNKMFGSIPVLHIVQPFYDKNYYSEIALTFLLSYYLGMLVRYFPTHWNSLVQGESGDIYWTVLNRAQNYVETVYPELIIELINDILKEKEK
jgi:hypothetical protein